MVTPTSKCWQCIIAMMLLVLLGCNRSHNQAAKPKLTLTTERSARRAYDGAPPVIPHEPLGAACITCHTQTGKLVPNMAFAPANPHGDIGTFQNCRQCHVFKQEQGRLVDNTFMGQSVALRKGERLFPGAPPTVPHSLLMRENCVACHDGPSARPEIRCTHPERINCVQCHVESSAPLSDVISFAQE